MDCKTSLQNNDRHKEGNRELILQNISLCKNKGQKKEYKWEPVSK